MEQRLFLAIILSLLVAFAFQSSFLPHTARTSESSQVVVQEGVNATRSPAAVSSQALPQQKIGHSAFAEETTILDGHNLRVELSNHGGDVKYIELNGLGYIFPAHGLISLAAFKDKPFITSFIDKDRVVYEHRFEGWLIKKEYQILSGRTMSCVLTLTNIGNNKSTFVDNLSAFIVDNSRVDKKLHSSDWTLSEYAISANNHFIRRSNIINLNDQWNKEQDVKINWFGFRDRYFTTIVEPKFAVEKYRVNALSASELDVGMPISIANIDPGQEIRFEFLIYAGPQSPEELKLAKVGFEKIMVFSNWGWLDAIAKAIYMLLGFTHKIIPVWGLCIILVSLAIYGLMYPLTLKSLTSMKKMQTIQPKIKALQEKHKKNPEKLNQEVVALYKEHGVNPLGGCLPMLLQMPIFVGLYQVLWRSIYFRGEGFLWIKDLSMPDRLIKLPANLPIIGEYFNILPVLMIGIMVAQQHFSSKNMVVTDPQQAAQQKMMTTFFPIFIGFIFYNFASGLNLYFVVFYLLSTAAQWKMSRERAAG